MSGHSHLWHAHGKTDAEYHAEYPGAPLICLAEHKKLSERSLRTWENERAGRRPRRNVRGHDEGPAPRWAMVCLATQGYSQEQIAADKSVKRTQVAVFRALDAVGLSENKPAIYYLGEPWTISTFRQLKAGTGLTAEELGQKIGAPRGRLIETLRPGRAMWKGRTRRIDTALARLGIAWCDETLSKLLLAKRRGSRSPDVIDKRRVLKTFFPSLQNRYKLLMVALREMRKYLMATPAPDAKALQDYLYWQAELRGNAFAEFLRWAPALMPFLEANFARLRAPGNLAPIACEAIGVRWNAPPTIVAEAIRSRTRPYTALEMRSLILGIPAVIERVAKPIPGRRKRGRPVERAEIFAKAKELHAHGTSWSKAAQQLTPEAFNQDPRRAAEALRKGVARMRT